MEAPPGGRAGEIVRSEVGLQVLLSGDGEVAQDDPIVAPDGVPVNRAAVRRGPPALPLFLAQVEAVPETDADVGLEVDEAPVHDLALEAPLAVLQDEA